MKEDNANWSRVIKRDKVGASPQQTMIVMATEFMRGVGGSQGVVGGRSTKKELKPLGNKVC